MIWSKILINTQAFIYSVPEIPRPNSGDHINQKMALDFLLDSILWKTNISWCHAPVSLANISWYFKNILWRKNNCFFENDQKIMYRSVLFGIFFKQPALDWLYLQYIHLVFILHYFKYSFCPMIFSINFPWWSLPIKNCSHFKLKYLLIGMSYH